jgi:hypothetical protein
MVLIIMPATALILPMAQDMQTSLPIFTLLYLTRLPRLLRAFIIVEMLAHLRNVLGIASMNLQMERK